MLSAGDDYPIHQTAEPVAFAGTDRNFYDRYFFNAQAPDGSAFFAAALGVYPHLGVIDAALCLVRDGQRSVFASQALADRMDTRVGPLRVRVEEPLHRLGLVLAETDGLALDAVFTGRHHPIEEPRFTRRMGTRTLMDVTRMTQNGDWAGALSVDGERLDLVGWRGTRDRSWGVRPIGASDPQPVLPQAAPQFFWLWGPLNFEHHALFLHTNDDADGTPWNRSAVLVDLASGTEMKLGSPEIAVEWEAGTRRAARATLTAQMPGGALRVAMEPGLHFHMHGVGYGHPRFGHGTWRGASVDTERFDAFDPAVPGNAHVQALVRATMAMPDGTVHEGRGVLEQLAIGPHAPSGFRELFDLA